MPTVTLQDCAKCPMVSKCTAHITGGSWDYSKGVDPCRIKMAGDCEMVSGRIKR